MSRIWERLDGRPLGKLLAILPILVGAESVDHVILLISLARRKTFVIFK